MCVVIINTNDNFFVEQGDQFRIQIHIPYGFPYGFLFEYTNIFQNSTVFTNDLFDLQKFELYLKK